MEQEDVGDGVRVVWEERAAKTCMQAQSAAKGTEGNPGGTME